MTMSVEPLSPALGAEIKVSICISLWTTPRSGHQRRSGEHVVVVAARSGSVGSRPAARRPAVSAKCISAAARPTAARPAATTTRVLMVTNIVENGKVSPARSATAKWFHHDTSYYPQPHLARDVCCIRYRRSPAGRRDLFLQHVQGLQNIRARCTTNSRRPQRAARCTFRQRERIDIASGAGKYPAPRAAGRSITHPATGKKALYIQPADVGAHRRLFAAGQQAALAQLFDITEDPAIVYEHEWRLGIRGLGQLVLVHAAQDAARGRELMRRCTIEGERCATDAAPKPNRVDRFSPLSTRATSLARCSSCNSSRASTE